MLVKKPLKQSRKKDGEVRRLMSSMVARVLRTASGQRVHWHVSSSSTSLRVGRCVTVIAYSSLLFCQERHRKRHHEDTGKHMTVIFKINKYD